MNEQDLKFNDLSKAYSRLENKINDNKVESYVSDTQSVGLPSALDNYISSPDDDELLMFDPSVTVNQVDVQPDQKVQLNVTSPSDSLQLTSPVAASPVGLDMKKESQFQVVDQPDQKESQFDITQFQPSSSISDVDEIKKEIKKCLQLLS